MKLKPLSVKDYKKSFNYEKVNRNIIFLSFIDFNFAPKEITNSLQLEPTEVNLKGKPLKTKYIKDKIADSNLWEYKEEILSDEFLGDLVEDFIERIINPRIDKIKLLNEITVSRFTIVQYYVNSLNPGFSLKKKYVKLLSEIDAELDLDIYCLYEESSNEDAAST